MAKLWLAAKEVQPLKPQAHTVLTNPRRRARAWRCCAISPALHLELQYLSSSISAWAWAWAGARRSWLLQRESERTKQPQAFVTFPYMSLGLGRRKVSFKLTNILPNSAQVHAAPAPLQSLSWIFPGFTLPFMSPLWLLKHMPQQKNFPFPGSLPPPLPPPTHPGDEGLFSGEIGKPPSSLLTLFPASPLALTLCNLSNLN